MTPLPPSDRSHNPRGFEPPAHPSSPAGSPRPYVRYRVLLHRSPDKDLMFIVRTVMELTHYCKEEATHRMWESYHRGSSQILVTHQERAELYVEQFTDRGLMVSLEPT
jgi:ATP-dependent Clp protease adaptor protein ClpS